MSTPATTGSNERLIQQFFVTLHSIWGPQHWWPAESPFEVIIGAFLTQNTAWTNVERAMANLRAAGRLTVSSIREAPLAELEQLVRPAGYFRQKASRLKNFVAFLDARFQGSLARMFGEPTDALRRELLALNGVGPETADSILLYAGNHPVFVVDAYTRRIVERHGVMPGDTEYEEIRCLFERSLRKLHLPASANLVARTVSSTDGLRGAAHWPSPVSTCRRSPFVQACNEMHALIVGLGKNHCFKRDPQCEGCPLQPFLPAVDSRTLSRAATANPELPKPRKA